MDEPRDPTPEEQLAARIWERYKTDKRYPYVKLGMKCWKDGCKNIGQIMDALAYLSSQSSVRSPWAVIASSPVMAQALKTDLEARLKEEAKVRPGPQLVGELLGGIAGMVQNRATDRAGSTAGDPSKPPNP